MRLDWKPNFNRFFNVIDVSMTVSKDAFPGFSNSKIGQTKKSTRRTCNMKIQLQDLPDSIPPKSFVVDWSNRESKPKLPSLQKCFLDYKKRREQVLDEKEDRKDSLELDRLKLRSDPERMEWLRELFLNQIKKYYGVPYKKKYWAPKDVEYHSPIFLDCCGLVRRALRDLRKDFGFRLGPWNQAYMHDTLPNTLSEEEMKPGDLVFISAIYYNPKAKKQKHNIVHVEVWLGEQEKTIGARWHKGHVQEFDSYRFNSTSYHSMRYIFKSIDTWLMGICQSFCNIHGWRQKHKKTTKKSIFAVAEQQRNFYRKYSTPALDSPQCISRNTEAASCMGVESDEDKPKNEVVKREGGHKVDGCGDHDNQTSRFLYPEAFLLNELEDRFDEDEIELLNNVMNFSSRNISIRRSSLTEFDPDLEEDVNPEIFGIQQPSSDDFLVYEDYADETDKMPKQDLLKPPQIERVYSPMMFEYDTDKHSCPVDCQCDYCWANGNDIIGETGDFSPTGGDLEENEKASLTKNLADQPESSHDVESQPLLEGDDKNTNESSKGNDVPSSDNVKQNLSRTTDQAMTSSDESLQSTTSSKGSKSTNFRLSIDKRLTKSQHQLEAPIFFIGGGNGVALIEAPLLKLGWERTFSKNDDSFKLKWTECKHNINYYRFKEREQMVNHIPNCNLLSNKLGLLNSLRDYDQSVDHARKRTATRLSFQDFFPTTFHIASERDVFESRYKHGELWVCKPCGMNQGRGIFIIRSLRDLNVKLQIEEDKKLRRKTISFRPPNRIIQKYISNPLLLDGRKFDIRAYMLVASTTPYLVLYHSGYVRLSCLPYCNDDPDNLTVHLTNQYLQKRDPAYKDAKEDTVWSMDKFNQYLNARVDRAPINWAQTSLVSQMKRIMLHCFYSVKSKLRCKMGYFELFGFDFMVDDHMKIWLLEVNTNPALHTHCETLKQVIPPIVEEALHITIECFEKSRRCKRILPLTSMRSFSPIYSPSDAYKDSGGAQRSKIPHRKVEPKSKLVDSVTLADKSSDSKIVTQSWTKRSSIRRTNSESSLYDLTVSAYIASPFVINNSKQKGSKAAPTRSKRGN